MEIIDIFPKNSIFTQPLQISLNPGEFTQKIILESGKKGEYYEPEISELLISLLQPGDCFIDIGAHVGYFSLLAAMLVDSSRSARRSEFASRCRSGAPGNGMVLSFEPESFNYSRILENIELNQLTNIRAFNIALGSIVEDRELFVNFDNDGGHAFWNVGRHEFNQKSRENPRIENVKLSRLDTILENEDIPRVKAIKIDTEGAEYEVLQGAIATISQHRVDSIICEINRFGLQQMGASENKIRELMASLGYRAYLLNRDRSLPWIELKPGEYYQSSYVFNLLFSRSKLYLI